MIFFWIIYWPGIFSPDSIIHYINALDGRYLAHHPVLIPYILSLFLSVGIDISFIILLQSQAGLFGLFFLAERIARVALSKGPKTAPSLIAGFVVFFLLLPISPLPMYLLTLWKDTWFFILLMWIGVLGIGLIHQKNNRLLLSFIALSSLAFCFRPNGVIFIIWMAVFIYWILQKNHPRWASFLISLSPIVLSLSILILAKVFLPIIPSYPFQTVMGVDLVGLLKYNPDLMERLPYTASYLKESTYKKNFRYGMEPDLRNGLVLTDTKFYDTAHKNNELLREYKEALKSLPTSLLWVKIKSFISLLTAQNYYWYETGIDESAVLKYGGGRDTTDLGLTRTEWASPIRNFIRKIWDTLGNDPLINPFGSSHLPWVFIMIIIPCLIRSPLSLFLSGLPLSYTCSYFLGVAAYDFRYLYPSTLFIQTVILSVAFSYVYFRIKCTAR